MSWFKRTRKLLNSEPETWIAYLIGQQFENLKHLQSSEPKYKGWFFRVGVWLFLLIKNARLRFSPVGSQHRILIYAGTHNQAAALESTLASLQQLGEPFCAIKPNGSTGIHAPYVEQRLGYVDAFKVVILAASRIRKLIGQLKFKNKALTKNKLDIFLGIYNELIYFDKIFQKTKPHYVVVSNDHNVPNRALLLTAKKYGIKTVYMQHASVSDLFPALTMDYAFLDGLHSLEIYRKCERNRIASGSKEICQVFLSGQKKNLAASCANTKRDYVGYAVNLLDNPDDIAKTVDLINSSKYRVKLRWHPSFSERKILELKSILQLDRTQYSDPTSESLSDFFGSIFCLISGNSSIHLEAALSNVVSICYEPQQPQYSDYYGYVRKGVCASAFTELELINLVDQIFNGGYSVDKESLRYFSSTFSTDLEGQEGDIVSGFLVSNSIPEGIECIELPESRLDVNQGTTCI